MGQKLVKNELERAEVFYNEQRFDEAVEEWKKALKKLKKPEEKFRICAKICLSLCDVGKYREALSYAGQQCELANQLNDVSMKSEAYFSVALCNEKSCEFSKAISYCRQSQQTDPEKKSIAGYIHMCMGNAYAGTSEFVKAWTNYALAMDTAKSGQDKILEILTSARMGALFW